MNPRTSSAATAKSPRSKLDREAVVDAAMRIADSEGLDAISFRRLADQFQVTPMALYWHFDDKAALLGAIAQQLWRETAQMLEASLAELDADGDDGWGQLRLTLAALIDVMRRHPAAAELVPMQVLECDEGREITELTLAFLARRGFDPESASDLAWFVLSCAVMLVTTQPSLQIPDGDARTEAMRHKHIALASLPPERYPHIIASAGFLTDCESPDKYFQRGFEAIVAGVRAQAPGASTAAT